MDAPSDAHDGFAGHVRVATADELGPVLAELGIVVVGKEGVTVRYREAYRRHLNRH